MLPEVSPALDACTRTVHISTMKRVTTRQARQNLAALLKAARAGEEIVITSPNESAVRLVAEEPSALARFRAWKATAVEIEEDPLAAVRDRADNRKVRL